MVIRERRYTLEDLRAIENLPENQDKHFELMNGEIIEMGTPNPLHNFIVAQFVFFLTGFVRPRGLGHVFGDVTSYTLSNRDELIPDASFISKERVPVPFPDKFLFAPDLAIEVASPSNRGRELLDKAESYLQSGTRLVWITYPENQVVDACRLGEDSKLIIRSVKVDGELEGEDVLPGFKLSVKDLFPAS